MNSAKLTISSSAILAQETCMHWPLISLVLKYLTVFDRTDTESATGVLTVHVLFSLRLLFFNWWNPTAEVDLLERRCLIRHLFSVLCLSPFSERLGLGTKYSSFSVFLFCTFDKLQFNFLQLKTPWGSYLGYFRTVDSKCSDLNQEGSKTALLDRNHCLHLMVEVPECTSHWTETVQSESPWVTSKCASVDICIRWVEWIKKWHR